jgi:DNA/RNA-binding domain of Phe-tRNA-synthetase-like protein
MEIRVELPGVTLGVVEADRLRIAPSEGEFSELLSEVCGRKQRECTVENLADAEPTRAIRQMFRAWGLDPSKYRPASEALLRRVVQGKGLYFVSNAVDIANLGSIETGWPYGCYDRARIKGSVGFRPGLWGERYEGIGKRTLHWEGRPVLADEEGPFGSPISDSTRTRITETTADVLAVIYAPANTADGPLERAMAHLCERLSRFARASATRSAILR